MTPDKALEYGLIDEIMGKEAKPTNTEELLQKLQEMQMEMNRQQSFREQIAAMQKNTPPQINPKEPKENTILNLFRGGNV